MTLAVAMGYCIAAAFFLRKVRILRPVVLVVSLLVCACFISEYVLLRKLGPTGAYVRLAAGFVAIHEVSFWLGPGAVANVLLLLIPSKSDEWNSLRVLAVGLVTWFACMVAVIGNFAVDEAIAGVDSGVPFYLIDPSQLTPTRHP